MNLNYRENVADFSSYFLLLLFILRINSIAFGAHADYACTGIVRYAVRPASFSVEELVAKLPDSCAGRLTLSPDSRYHQHRAKYPSFPGLKGIVSREEYFCVRLIMLNWYLLFVQCADGFLIELKVLA